MRSHINALYDADIKSSRKDVNRIHKRKQEQIVVADGNYVLQPITEHFFPTSQLPVVLAGAENTLT